MPLPTLTAEQFLSNATREELESLVIQINGYLSQEHKENGSHGDVTADSLDVEGNAAVGGDLSVVGDATVTDTLSTTDLSVSRNTVLGKGLCLPGEDSVQTNLGGGDISSYITADSAPVVMRVSAVGGNLGGIPAAGSTFLGGLTGRFHYLLNDTSSTFTIDHDSAAASAAPNRLYTPDGLNYQIRPNEMVGIWRDETDSRWRVIGAVAAVGTWTPGLAFGGGTTGITYSARSGSRTRVGPLVHVEANLTLSSKGSSTGSATVTGLEFAAANNPMNIIDPIANFSGLTGTPFVAISTSTLNLLQTSATGRTALDDTHFTNTTQFRIALTYRV